MAAEVMAKADGFRNNGEITKSELTAFLGGDENTKDFYEWLMKDKAQGGDDVDYDAMFDKMAGAGGTLDLAELERAAQAYLDAGAGAVIDAIVAASANAGLAASADQMEVNALAAMHDPDADLSAAAREEMAELQRARADQKLAVPPSHGPLRH